MSRAGVARFGFIDRRIEREEFTSRRIRGKHLGDLSFDLLHRPAVALPAVAADGHETSSFPGVAVIDLLQGASQEQAAFVLAKPREALTLVHGMPTALRDPRLSRAGNWLARHLTQALEALVRVENWLRTPNERELRAQDRQIVQPLLARVGDQASVVAELVLGPDLKRERKP